MIKTETDTCLMASFLGHRG